jgi:hypothetical protein
MPRPQVDTGRAAYSMLLGVSALLLIGALSFRQLTAPSVAQQLMAEGIASLTEIDTVLRDHEADLDALTSQAEPNELLTVPGFPLQVRFTRAEYEDATMLEFRDLILGRGASLVYEDGLDAFTEGSGASISLFSTEGVLDWLVGLLGEKNHGRSGIAAALLAIITTVAAVMVVVRSSGFSRVRALGVPLVLAAAAGLLATVILEAVLGRWWGGDPFSDEVSRIISDGLGIGQRNFAILGALGLILVVTGIVFELLGRFVLRDDDRPDLPEFPPV